MANDREVLREIWDGRIPVCFQLDSSEVNGLQAPDPYYLMVPRLSYFPLVTDKIRRHFQRYIHPDKHDAEMWMDFNGQPLKWHYPIGVLFDLHIQEISLPWSITIHFDKFPEAELLHCTSREAVESYFMSCIKEADVLKHRSQVVSNMQRRTITSYGLDYKMVDKFDQFWAVNRKLMEVGSNETFKYIPFRLYQGDEPFIQRLVKPITEEGQKKTLLQFLQEIYAENASKVKVTTHGVEPPTDTPLQWMSEHLSYPDNFLHLCIAF